MDLLLAAGIRIDQLLQLPGEIHVVGQVRQRIVQGLVRNPFLTFGDRLRHRVEARREFANFVPGRHTDIDIVVAGLEAARRVGQDTDRPGDAA